MSNASWVPSYWFWPGSFVLGRGATLYMDQAGQTGEFIPSSYLPQVFAKRCPVAGGAPAYYSPTWMVCYAGDSMGNGNPKVGAQVVQIGAASGALATGVTGSLTFEPGPGVGSAPRQIITTMDGSPQQTVATPGYVRAGSAGDSFIGTDTTGNVGTQDQTYGAPGGHNFYVNDPGTNAANAKFSILSAGATFRIPVTFNTGVTLAGITGTTQCLHVSATGAVTGTGSDCGSGGGGGSGTVNSGGASQVAMYSASGAAVSGDGALTDSGTVLNYAGSGGIASTSGSFSGNVTVGGQLILTGPWMADTPIPSLAMTAAPVGTSSIGISNDGNFYISTNAGGPSQVQTAAAVATTLSGYVPNTTTVNGHALTGNVTVNASDIATGTLPHAQLPALVSGDIPNNGANTSGSAASLSAASTLPSGTMATTQGAHDNSTKVATTAYVDSAISGVSTSWITAISASYSGAYPSSAANKCLMWGFTLPVAVQTSQISYYVGANADNTSTYNYDLGIFNSSGTLLLNLNAGTLHGSAFAPATVPITQPWVQGSTLLLPGAYYLAYYSSNTTATAPTLYGASGNAPVFYKSESGSSGAQGSLGFSITPRTGGMLPTSIAAPAANGPQASYMPMFWLH